MSKMVKCLTTLGKSLFSKEKVFPYWRIYRVLGIPFVFDIRNRIKKGQIQNNKVVFWSTTNKYACNPKYIAEALLGLNKDIDVVWVVDKQQTDLSNFPQEVRVVSKPRDAVYEISTARVFVANERTMHWLSKGLDKKNGQVYINTWHGSLGIKKTGVDRPDFKAEDYKRCELDSSLYDVLLSNGTYSTELYSRIFFNHGSIYEVGLPRNDLFFKKATSKFKKAFNINSEAKVVLYAPTWRERKNQSIEAFDGTSVIRALESRFGGSWQLVYRLHHRHNKSISMTGINVSEYPDIQEIMAEVDVVITDYSSCIYDFVLTKKPGFIFATDRDEYDNSRGLYYPLEKTPFPVAETQETLIENILSFNEKLYQERVESFLKEKGCREDGNAAYKVAIFIEHFIRTGTQDFEKLSSANTTFRLTDK